MNPPSNVLLAYPLSITAKEKYVYFLPRQSFNLGGMLSNPMMLLMIGCGAMVLLMPYIMVGCRSLSLRNSEIYVIQSRLDPEVLEELKKEQAKFSRSIEGDTTSSGFAQIPLFTKKSS